MLKVMPPIFWPVTGLTCLMTLCARNSLWDNKNGAINIKKQDGCLKIGNHYFNCHVFKTRGLGSADLDTFGMRQHRAMTYAYFSICDHSLSDYVKISVGHCGTFRWSHILCQSNNATLGIAGAVDAVAAIALRLKAQMAHGARCRCRSVGTAVGGCRRRLEHMNYGPTLYA